MKAIDTRGNLDDHWKDDKKISNDVLSKTCLIYQKEKTCKYIILVGSDYFCGKNTSMREVFDKLALENKMLSKADNCDGLGTIYEKEKTKKE